MFRMYVNEKFLLSYLSWEVLRFKFKRGFKNHLMINWRLAIQKLFWHHPSQLNAFSPSRISHFIARIWEHLGISHLTGKKVKIDNNKLTAIQEHFLCCNYPPSYKDFSTLTMESNGFKLKIMENLLITRNKSCLNKRDSSLPKELFLI